MEEKKAKEEKKKQEAAGPKLFELADEFEKEEAARHEDKCEISLVWEGGFFYLITSFMYRSLLESKFLHTPANMHFCYQFLRVRVRVCVIHLCWSCSVCFLVVA